MTPSLSHKQALESQSVFHDLSYVKFHNKAMAHILFEFIDPDHRSIAQPDTLRIAELCKEVRQQLVHTESLIHVLQHALLGSTLANLP